MHTIANFGVIIPAIKKNVVFHDDLVKKLVGISLIERAIINARKLSNDESIVVVTDSEEIQLIAKRCNVKCILDRKSVVGDGSYFNSLKQAVEFFPLHTKYHCFLSPYAPLLSAGVIKSAYTSFVKSEAEVLRPIKLENHCIVNETDYPLVDLLSNRVSQLTNIEFDGFAIYKNAPVIEFLENPAVGASVSIEPFVVEYDELEIRSLQDWWVAEKLLKRKRIIFRVIGSNKIGMGHIFRALSLAHEISDHEVLFVTDTENEIVVNRLAGYDYWLGVYQNDEVLDEIIALKPDLVINDVLSTEKSEIKYLQDQNIKVVNFEDVGSGAACADITYNELYDTPLFEGNNIRWGHEYLFVRDEFDKAKKNKIPQSITSILIAFGGTDQHDLTMKCLNTVYSLCLECNVKIHVVIGPGYPNHQTLFDTVQNMDNVILEHSTAVISNIMEQCQWAITSNGRTVYELAHLNIPAIVISQHVREETHNFATLEHGFLRTGVYSGEKTLGTVLKLLKRVLEDHEFRNDLYFKINPFEFSQNKKKVIKEIQSLLTYDENI